MCTSRILAIVVMLVFTTEVSGVGGNDKRTIRVTGEGTVSAIPDTATIHSGVVTQAKTAVEALEQNKIALEKMMADLKRLEIAEKDIQTSRFRVQPIYDRAIQREWGPTIVGYRVSTYLRIRVRNIKSLGELLDTLIRSGSNQMSGISFAVDNKSSIMNKARAKAVEDAKARADLYAKSAGVAVGKVISIDEQRAVVPRPVFFGRAMEAKTTGVPVAIGEQDFRATINMTFELVDRESREE